MFSTRMALRGLALCASIASTAAAALPAAPADVVNTLHSSLTETMTQSAKLGCEGRLKRLQPVVEASFDLPFVAERALRRSWKTLDEAQRQRFTAALRRSFITTYATEFSTPGAVTFATGSSEPLANGDVLVHSTLTPNGGSAITLDYVLRQRAEHWQVVNVLADGVSDLALRATQYEGLMKSSHFDALIARLDAQTQTLRSRCQ